MANDIQGWFDDDFRAVYQEQVARVSPPAVFVEVGCWKGRSTVAMAEMIRRSGKDIHFVAVDHCKGNPSEPLLTAEVALHGGSIGAVLRKNLEGHDVDLLVATSMDAARLFDPESVDFVFLDGDHREEAVRGDLAAWWPKVKAGGWLGGHDYTVPGFGVQAAFDDFFRGYTMVLRGPCALVRKGEMS